MGPAAHDLTRFLCAPPSRAAKDATQGSAPRNPVKSEMREDEISENKAYTERLTLPPSGPGLRAELKLRSGVWTKESGSSGESEGFPVELKVKRLEKGLVFGHFLAQKSDQVEAGRSLGVWAPFGQGLEAVAALRTEGKETGQQEGAISGYGKSRLAGNRTR